MNATNTAIAPKKTNDVRETWKEVAGYPGYSVSDAGRLRGISGRILRPALTGNGYRMATLCNASGHKIHLIHRLIAAAFCGEEFGEVNHKDGDRLNNAASNLEWVSRSDNQRHAHDLGLKPTGIYSHLCKKLDDAKVKAIRSMKGQFSQAQIGQIFGISQTYVGKIHRGMKWRNPSIATK